MSLLLLLRSSGGGSPPDPDPTPVVIATAISGKKTYFMLGGYNISRFLDAVTPSMSPDEWNATTYQATGTTFKQTIYGFDDHRYQLSGKWTMAAEAVFFPIRRSRNVAYVYGPEGHAEDMLKISGFCNIGKYSGPVSSVNGVTTFTLELAVNTRDVDFFAADGL